MMGGAFPVGSMEGYEVYPDKLEILNTTKKSAHFAIIIEGGKTVIMLVTAQDASDINLDEGRDHGPSDTV